MLFGVRGTWGVGCGRVFVGEQTHLVRALVTDSGTVECQSLAGPGLVLQLF